MLLAYDVESSGLLKPGLDSLDPSQPALVQLGAQLFDRNWVKRAHLTVLIKPDGWGLEAGAESVHGISTQTCARYGIALAEALIPFRGLVEAASRIIAHNMNFDRHVIASAIHRAGGQGLWWAKAAPKLLCTMETSTEVCALPGQFGSYKFPSLEEAVAALVPDAANYPVRHDADSDIAATVAVYRALLERGIVKDNDPFARKL